MVFARQWFAGTLLRRHACRGPCRRSCCKLLKIFLCALSCALRRLIPTKAKSCLTFCKKISTPLKKALEKQNTVLREPKANRPVMHVLCFGQTIPLMWATRTALTILLSFMGIFTPCVCQAMLRAVLHVKTR